MSLLRRVRSWKNTPAKLRKLLLEATWELFRARLTVAFGLRKALPVLLETRRTDDIVPPVEIEAGVRRSIRIAAETVPWKSICLPNAIAAKRMLARRGYNSTIHLGVGNRETGDLHAHAWLEAGGGIITGAEGMEGISALPSAFSRARNGIGAK